MVRLTARQQEALALIGEGLSVSEMALRLGVTPRSAKAYSDLLRHKFGVEKKRQLIVIAQTWKDEA